MTIRARVLAVVMALSSGMLLAAAPGGAPAAGPGRGAPGATVGGAPGRGRGAPLIPMSEPADLPMVRVDQQWSGRHTAFLQTVQKGDVDLYLLGDSITDNWGGAQFRESYTKYFGGWKTANFGIGGDRTEHVLWRIKNGELDAPIKPKAIVLLIGTNNLPRTQYNYSAESPEETAKAVKEILDVIKQKQPQAKVLLVSVFPREDGLKSNPPEDLNPKVKALNALIAKNADGKQIIYLDIYDKFLDENGKLKPGLMPNDGLHPVAAGYDIWGQAMMPILTEWLGAPKPKP
ncbi:MAG TPA: GDSL-type esterase/lipase family protein [Phycisphaerae bacterium]|jgi:lysophospholipase L1-like esterase